MTLTGYTPFNITMEAEVIKSFLPDLVTGISDCVQPVSDQCLAKGLVPDSVYKRVLESGGTSEDKARTLILSVKKSTETDCRCLETFLNILEEQLPFRIREKLLLDIRKEANENSNTYRAVVQSSTTFQVFPTGKFPWESTQEQSSMLGRFEESIRQHERTCAEKNQLKEKLKVKTEECERLKNELESMKGQKQDVLANIQSRITEGTSQITNLTERLRQIQITMEEQGMLSRRSRHTIITETKKICVQLVRQYQQAIQMKEEEHKAALRATEASLLQKGTTKEREYQLEIKEKEIRIRELEDESKQLKETATSQSPIPQDVFREKHLSLLLGAFLPFQYNNTINLEGLAYKLGFSIEEVNEIGKILLI